MNIIMEAISQAMEGKQQILSIMADSQAAPRDSRKDNGPVVEKLDVPGNKRNKLVGIGGFNLKKLMADTGM